MMRLIILCSFIFLTGCVLLEDKAEVGDNGLKKSPCACIASKRFEG